MAFFGRPFVKRFALCYRTVVLSVLSVLSVTLVYCGQTVGRITTKLGTGRPRPWPHCVRRGPSSPSYKGARTPNFGPYLLRPNGCIDQDGTWHGGRPRPRRLCVRWGPTAPPQKGGGAPPPIFGPFILWPKGWMHQDATRYGGMPQPTALCVRWGPSPLAVCWPNGWMHQDATWCGGRPQPRGLCVRWGPSPLLKREWSPQFSTHVYCGQTVACIKMALGMDVGLGPGHIVLDGDPAPLSKNGAEALNFRPIFIVAKRLDASTSHLLWR